METLSQSPLHSSVLERVEFFRQDANRKLDDRTRVEMGQFMTPAAIARFMASLFQGQRVFCRVLDAGAGVGSLTAAWVEAACALESRPKSVSVVAYEQDSTMVGYLESTLQLCQDACASAGITFTAELRKEDFIEAGTRILSSSLFESEDFDCAILNPPYRKINSESETRGMLRDIGVETSNLYTGFLAIVSRLLKPGGELVAITPRSFCNGPYFRSFREDFLGRMALDRLHVFESRKHAFQEDDVLQENVIFHAVKSACVDTVIVSSGSGPEDELPTMRAVPYTQVVQPGDPDIFIHIATDELSRRITEQAGQFRCSLEDLGIAVSTGRVVDFRATDYLRSQPDETTVPLIYPTHFNDGYVDWPRADTRKPNAIVACAATADLLVPSGAYVLVKRFSSKEEKRRIVAAIFDPARIDSPGVGFENHLNYYHADGSGLPINLAKGLAVFLNSTLMDSYFRTFNGHTQVNATDLRSFKYPSREQFEAVGARIGASFPDQDEVDRIMERDLMAVSDGAATPVQAKKKIEEAAIVLRALGLPKGQQNERSALTLLAMLDLKPGDVWQDAGAPQRGITQMMDFFAEHYGKRYAPNSRETVRRQTVHQFREAGLLVENPDKPDRPTNSGKTVYQIETSALKLVRSFGTDVWIQNVKEYLTSIETLANRYAQAREMQRLPLRLGEGMDITLSPGGQNVLVKRIIDDFCPRYIPGGKPVYVGDTDDKFAYYDKGYLASLGVKIEVHGKMPDVVVHHTEKDWLVLIEAVTSHGPVNPKRHNELKALFADSAAGLVFVTAFLTRRDMARYLGDISWETEVWVAECPDHMVHFNGERFLGPY